eukprot:UN22632
MMSRPFLSKQFISKTICFPGTCHCNFLHYKKHCKWDVFLDCNLIASTKNFL